MPISFCLSVRRLLLGFIQLFSGVLQLCPEAADKTYTLIGYATGTDHDIEDPFGGDSDVYLKTLDQIELALVVLLIKLYPQHAEEIRRVYEPKG